MDFFISRLRLLLELIVRVQVRCSKSQPFFQNQDWSRTFLKLMARSTILANFSKKQRIWRYQVSWLFRTSVVLYPMYTLLDLLSEHRSRILADILLSFGWLNPSLLLLMFSILSSAQRHTFNSVSNLYSITTRKIYNFCRKENQAIYSIFKTSLMDHLDDAHIPKPSTSSKKYPSIYIGDKKRSGILELSLLGYRPKLLTLALSLRSRLPQASHNIQLPQTN